MKKVDQLICHSLRCMLIVIHMFEIIPSTLTLYNNNYGLFVVQSRKHHIPTEEKQEKRNRPGMMIFSSSPETELLLFQKL